MKKILHKSYYYKILFLFSFSGVFFFVDNVSAQQDSIKLFDFSGKLVSSDSLKPLIDAHILSRKNRWGTISNNNGMFRILLSDDDSLLISSIGYRSRIVRITDSILDLTQPVMFRLNIDTILIHEVIIHAYWDYRTFKQMIINMKPLDLKQFYPDMNANPWLYRNPPMALTVKGPIQALYDIFNKNARLQRKLVRDRKQYNRLMIMLGRTKDTIPAIPEYMRVKQH